MRLGNQQAHPYNVVIVKLNGMTITQTVTGLWSDALIAAEELLNEDRYADANPRCAVIAMADGQSKDTCTVYDIVWKQHRRRVVNGR